MKKVLFFALFCALSIGISGCSSTPEISMDSQNPLRSEFHRLSDEILQSGGLAATGVAKSKSLDIALNKAKNDGRIKLADLLEAKFEALQKEISEETMQTIIANNVQGLTAKELKHEVTNGIVTAYALMELDPNVLNQATETLSAE